MTIRNQAVTVASEEKPILRLSRAPASNLLTVSGAISANTEEKLFFVTVHDPALYAAARLKRAMESKGIAVGGSITGHPPQLGPIASYTSPPLREVVRKINKTSLNLHAELLFRTLGKTFHGDGSAEAATAVLKDTLAKMAISPDSVVVYDGSGLSRMNLVTPSAILALLEYMHRHENFSYFLDSLPVAGTDGTLKERLRNTSAEGRIFAKTGSMTHVLNLSGYLKDRKGKMFAFSIMTNNYAGPTETLKGLQDALLVSLVDLLD